MIVDGDLDRAQQNMAGKFLSDNQLGLRDQNKGGIFISHDIVEIMAVCDRVTILRDGEIVYTLPKEQYDSHTMKQYMVSREIEENYRTDYENRLTDGSRYGRNTSIRRCSKTYRWAHYGEILGIGGLTDCGMRGWDRFYIGLRRPVAGSVCTGDGTPLKNPFRCVKKENRIHLKKPGQGGPDAFLSTILENICLPSLDKVKKRGCSLRRGQRRRLR